KPPLRLGHRKAIMATLKLPSTRLWAARMLRLKNCRRFTPRDSGSAGASPKRISPPPMETTDFPAPTGSRLWRASPARARASSLSSTVATAAPVSERSALRASLVSEPVEERWREIVVATASNPASTRRTGMAIRRTVLAFIGGYSSALEVEEGAGLPGVDEVEARAPEERADDDEHGPEHQEHGEEADGELAVVGFRRWVLVDVGGHHQDDQAHAGDRHAGHHRVPDREQLLEAEEVPRRLRRVGCLVEVGLFQQWRPDQSGEDRDQRHEAEHRHALADQ